MYCGTDEFKVFTPNDWDAKKDIQYVADCVGEADERALVEQLGESYASIGYMLSTGIKFFLGPEGSSQYECLDYMSVTSKIEILGRLIRDNPPASGDLERFEQDLANCVTAEIECNRILYKYAVNAEKLWLSELQKSSDNLKVAEYNLDESIYCEYENYPAYYKNQRPWSGPLER